MATVCSSVSLPLPPPTHLGGRSFSGALRRKHTTIAAASPSHLPPLLSPPKSLSTSILAPLAVCLVFTSCCAPVEAGILSGSPGLESFQLPSLPTPEVLKKMQEDNKTRYEGLDAKFKSSPYVQELLKRSKENIEKRKREIQDKYCQRGADWGVGDCSMAAMSEQQRAAFAEALKSKEASQ